MLDNYSYNIFINIIDENEKSLKILKKKKKKKRTYSTKLSRISTTAFSVLPSSGIDIAFVNFLSVPSL